MLRINGVIVSTRIVSLLEQLFRIMMLMPPIRIDAKYLVYPTVYLLKRLRWCALWAN